MTVEVDWNIILMLSQPWTCTFDLLSKTPSDLSKHQICLRVFSGWRLQGLAFSSVIFVMLENYAKSTEVCIFFSWLWKSAQLWIKESYYYIHSGPLYNLFERCFSSFILLTKAWHTWVKAHFQLYCVVKKNVIVDGEGQKYVMKIIKKKESWANKIPDGRNGSCKMKKKKKSLKLF